jgi:hypothetical protein
MQLASSVIQRAWAVMQRRVELIGEGEAAKKGMIPPSGPDRMKICASVLSENLAKVL